MLPRPPDGRVRVPLHGQPVLVAAVVDAGGAGRALRRVDARLHRRARPPPRRRQHQVQAQATDPGGVVGRPLVLGHSHFLKNRNSDLVQELGKIQIKIKRSKIYVMCDTQFLILASVESITILNSSVLGTSQHYCSPVRPIAQGASSVPKCSKECGRCGAINISIL